VVPSSLLLVLECDSFGDINLNILITLLPAINRCPGDWWLPRYLLVLVGRLRLMWACLTFDISVYRCLNIFR
jgi:hypothetical protein